MEFGVPFIQREPLTGRIKKLIKDYSDGLSVPKELIQNADDAQATETILVYDTRHHHNSNLSIPGLSSFMGPALLFYNNKQFTDKDFESLCKFGVESKDRQKVGRFGLGFNAVYNITDLPQFVSGLHFCALDPHERYLEGVGKFKLTKVKKNEVCGKKIRDVLAPFEKIAGFSLDKVLRGTPFPGTIFRLPLRTAVS